MQDEELGHILSDEEEMKKRTYLFPTSQIKIGSRKSSYFDVIKSREFESCTEEARWLISVYDKNKIVLVIDKIPFISDIRREFYEKIIDYRFQHIFAEVI